MRRGVTFNAVPLPVASTASFLVINDVFYGVNYAVHSTPHYFTLQSDQTGVSMTLEDSSGAEYALQSFWLAGDPTSGCATTFSITGSINGGPPVPACVVAPFIVGGGAKPILIAFNPPCLATTVTITPIVNSCSRSAITLDDVTVCAITSTSSIYLKQASQ